MDRDRSSHIPSLTPLRGIAALFVVAFHLQFWVPNLGYLSTAPAFLLGYLWVDFFFLLSGFVISHAYGGWLTGGLRSFPHARFLYVRLSRVYPLHVAMLATLVGFELVQIGLHSLGRLPGFEPFTGARTVPGILSNLLLINGWNLHDRLVWNFPAWSISAELAAYIAFPVIWLCLRALPAAFSWLAFTLLLAALNALALTNGGRLAIHYDYGVVRCLLEFSMGVLVYRAYRSRQLVRWLRTDVAFMLAMGWILALMATLARDVLIIPGFALLLLVAAHNTGIASRVLNSRPLTHLGDVSYSVYMVNVPIIIVFVTLWRAVTGERFGVGFDSVDAWAAWGAAVALVIAVATATHRHVEVPARASLRRVLRQREGTAPEGRPEGRALSPVVPEA
jgi:peptidoglycan/LPS O-acetylase OafA/YrhL